MGVYTSSQETAHLPAPGISEIAGSYSERALEGDLVPADALDSSVGDCGLAVLENGVDIDRLPCNGRLLLC